MPEAVRPSWDVLQTRLQQAGMKTTDCARPILFVDSSQQKLWQLAADGCCRMYPVSTSRHGCGQQQGSYQTPLGIHRIAQKIGADAPFGSVFKARAATGEICHIDADDARCDVITSRILWLEGLQQGYNRGADVDSYARMIYIHGTADEAHIGKPASIGCIRLKNDDIIELFAQVEVGDLVIIE